MAAHGSDPASPGRVLLLPGGIGSAPGEPAARLAARLLLTVTPARRRLARHSVGCQPEPGSDSESESEGPRSLPVTVTVTCHVIWPPILADVPPPSQSPRLTQAGTPRP
jgi:hypothetical protein